MQKQKGKTEDETPTFCPKSREEWREWLQENHDEKQAVWLIYYKKKSNQPSVLYSEAVDEALCFGWIDSKAKPLDDERFMQFFTRRKEKSVWSKVNKNKIERLIKDNLMTKAGFETIEKAKKNGSWTILDEAEALIIPADLDEELEKRPNAKQYFSGLSRSDKRNILQWLVLAKRVETREKRISEIVELADKNQKPKQFSGQKKSI
ncbi:YdeI/OmpD-associated family protein [Dyadobacter sp. CY345]|uniref:YdeI/OmpD-associated family protein n=1 Tax=Dyadobacter sp. CY345 TaxID=2909335 RepID=UPI001F2A866D|nr:YdeI/OmpD-associated family protein [Dyadobacter sp. CY345]MCF2444000.1 YdeI/OmpD-associated family protein [Dyadobacter sp. CY345]